MGAIVRYGAPTNSLEETPPVFANESLDVPPDIIHLKIVNFSTWAYRIESEVSTLTGTLRDKVSICLVDFLKSYPESIVHSRKWTENVEPSNRCLFQLL